MKYIILIIALTITGCASTTKLVINTVPDGATIVSDSGAHFQPGQEIGFEWTPAFVRNGCFHAEGFTAIWVSGAYVYTGEHVTLCQQGKLHTLTLRRPADAPGYEIDAQHAMQVRMHKLQQDQYDREMMYRAIQENAVKIGGAIGSGL